MKIDDLYSGSDKNYYYLGVVSQVYRTNCVVQVENLTWLNLRRIRTEVYYPNSISYYVVIDSSVGIFIGEVYQNKFPDASSVHKALLNEKYEEVFPDLSVDVKSVILGNGRDFVPVGFNSVGVTDKVYIANQDVVKRYIRSLELSSSYARDKKEEKKICFAKSEQFDNIDISLFPETLFDRHLMIIGSTNSGKSTTSLSVLDNLIDKDIKMLVIDPTGEYSESFINEKQVEKCVLGKDIYLDAGRISIPQWSMLFEANDASQPPALESAIKSLRYQMKIGKGEEVYKKVDKTVLDVDKEISSLTKNDINFNISLLSKQLEEEAVQISKNGEKYEKSAFQYNNKHWLIEKVEYKLANTNLLKFFTEGINGTKDLLNLIDDYIKNDKSLYLNASKISIGDGVGSMIIDVICNYVINQDISKDNRAFIIFVDEVHRYTKDISNSGYQTALSNIAREGRKKGIFLFLTTQSPQDVPDILLSQVGSLIVHRLTHKNELDAIRNHISEDLLKIVPKLTQGEAVLTSINLLNDLKIKVKKCNRSHDNQTKML